ncbi:hypothetical protein [Bacillus manliponensis]|uniref:hypothetical protein n=1 Tax=Bacillus manliponensis TaxID=574376 RepID=UPI003512B451
MVRRRLKANSETTKELIQELNDPNRFSRATKLYKNAIELGKRRKKENETRN